MKNYLDEINLNIIRRFIYLIFFIFSIFLSILILFYALGFDNYLSKLNEKTSKPDTNLSTIDELFSNTIPGPVGPAGPTGPQGLPGEKGEKGDQGPTGKQGPLGPVGPIGPAGSSGSTGATGAQGIAGPQGIQGLPGATGAQGSVGATGAKGEKGDQGEKGEKGDKGDPGSDGITTLGYRGSFHDTTTQTHTAINTAKAMKLNTTNTNETSGVSITNNSLGEPTRITVANTGTYNLQFSAQLARTTGHKGTVNAEIWLRRMNSNVDMSNTKITLSGDEDSAKAVASWNFLVYLDANQFVELMWTVDDLRLEMPTITTGLNGPNIPSLIVTMTQVG